MAVGNVAWPALAQCEGDDELLYLASEEDWARHCRAFGLGAGDRLVDSAGACHLILRLSPGGAELGPGGARLTLETVLALVRAHAAARGSCCVAKLGARSIADAVRLVGQLANPAR